MSFEEKIRVLNNAAGVIKAVQESGIDEDVRCQLRDIVNGLLTISEEYKVWVDDET